MNCTACLKPKLADGYDVCFPCTKARHRAVLNRRCTCRKADRRERVVDLRFRRYVTCDRCLGPVRNLSDRAPKRDRAWPRL